jgi:hypothetical protein
MIYVPQVLHCSITVWTIHLYLLNLWGMAGVRNEESLYNFTPFNFRTIPIIPGSWFQVRLDWR